MKVRYLELSDYDTLYKWWKDNLWPKPPTLDDLPIVNGELQGLMVFNDDVEICAGFLINTSVKNGLLMEYIVANFEVKDRELRKQSLNLLINTICDTAKAMGKKYIFSSLKHPSLLNRYKDCGFTEGSKNTVEMIRPLTDI